MDSSDFKFEVIHESSISNARVGKIYTPHGVINTPCFVPVGTNATIKSLDSLNTENLNVQLMFCNTYHLLLRPGTEVIKKNNGIHKFMNRKSPVITDSGGFQVFSLAYGGITDELKSKGAKKHEGIVLKKTEEGVTFRSYVNGDKIMLSPESSVQAQKAIGADIILPLDELPPYHITDKKLLKSFERTHRWEMRSLKTHLDNPKNQAMYGIVHGNDNIELRKKSAEILSLESFNGFAIGGSLGKTRDQMMDILSHTIPSLDRLKPVHLLGIGDLESVDRFIPLGVDTFDSSYPTKAARHGVLLTNSGTKRIKSRVFELDLGPIERDCDCYTCRNYNLSYLHHLFKANESIYMFLATIHNIAMMVGYTEKLRKLILEDRI